MKGDGKMEKYMELVFILDRSGSMGGLESDTIGGYNSFLKKQQEEAGPTRITTVLFDDEYELLHDRLDLKAVAPITEKDYYVRGCTALLDAIGKTIGKVENVKKGSSKKYKPDKVLFVITTDGMENASREFSYDQIKAKVEAKKEEGWEFIFMGANIDSIDVAGRFGIARNRVANYHADTQGINAFFCTAADVSAKYSLAEAIDDDWAADLNADFEGREKGEDPDGDTDAK